MKPIEIRSRTSAAHSSGQSVSRVNDEIEVGYDSAFEDKWWKFVIVCWIMLTVLLMAALTGVLGRGPLSGAWRSSADASVQLHYDRVLRFRTPSELTVEIASQRSGRDTIHLWVSRVFQDRLMIQRILPSPTHQTSTDGGITYTFRCLPGQPVRIRLQITPEQTGRATGEIRLTEASLLRFDSFVVP